MKASELIQKLWWSIAAAGDGVVCVAGLANAPAITGVHIVKDEHDKPIYYLLCSKGRALMETPDTDQSIRDEIDEIGRELDL